MQKDNPAGGKKKERKTNKLDLKPKTIISLLV
jgi:hypothetical protein